MRPELGAWAGLALAAALLSGCASRAGSGDGQVIDYVSREPVPHARVELTCSISKPVHGSIRETYTAESREPDGAYHFDPSKLGRCEYFFARATKPGYAVDSGTAMFLPTSDTEHTLPTFVYLIKESDLPLVNIRYLLDQIPRPPYQAGADPGFNFRWIYPRFLEARKLATTPELNRLVRDRFCPALQAAYAVMSAQQQAGLHEDVRHINGEVYFRLRPDTYEEDVRPYCGD